MTDKESRKVKRVHLDNPIKVVICSIGGGVKYDMTTRDISSTGFFLEYDSPARFPFNRSSILEVWLTIGADNTLFFNGKMARVVYPDPKTSPEEATSPGIGIKIVQINEENETKLEVFLKNKMLELNGISA